MESNRPAKPALFANLFFTPLALLLAGCAGPAITSFESPEPPPVAAKPPEPPAQPPAQPPVIPPKPDADVELDITFNIFKADVAYKRGDYAGAIKLCRIELFRE